MKTTGNIFMALASIFLCFSCVKADRVYEDAQREIALEPIGIPTVKADGESAAYPDDGIFGLYACYSDCAGSTAWDAAEAWSASSVYFENAAFRKTDQSAWAGYDPQTSAHKPYYWPLQGSLMFAGYSPHSSQHEAYGVTSVELQHGKYQGVNPYFEIGFTQKTTVSEMVDLLWFDPADVNAGKTLSTTTAPVPVVFRHALSKVTLNFVDETEHYRIKSAALKDCINQGTFYSGKTAGWMPVIDALAHYVPEIETGTSEDGKTIYPILNGWSSGDMLIIPQYLDGIFPTMNTGTLDSGVDVMLEFTVADEYGEQTVSIRMDDYTHQWEIGKHYTYTINVNADKIDFGAPSITVTTQTVSM